MQENDRSGPRLVYFELRGRAEAIRILHHATGTAFDDHRVVARDEWERLVPTLPFGVLPTYEAGALTLCESHAILRHLGRTLTPAPSDEATRAALDVAQAALAEAQEDLWRFNWVADYYDHLEAYARETLVPRLERLERWLLRPRANASEWFGDDFGAVDCLAFCFLDEVDAFFPSVLAARASLAALRSRVAEHAGVAEYLVSGDRPLVFGMGSMGPKVDPRIMLPPEARLHNPWTEPLALAPIRDRQRRFDRAPD